MRFFCLYLKLTVSPFSGWWLITQLYCLFGCTSSSDWQWLSIISIFRLFYLVLWRLRSEVNFYFNCFLLEWCIVIQLFYWWSLLLKWRFFRLRFWYWSFQWRLWYFRLEIWLQLLLWGLLCIFFLYFNSLSGAFSQCLNFI